MSEHLENEQVRTPEDDKSEIRGKIVALVTEIDERLTEIKEILAGKVHERKEAA